MLSSQNLMDQIYYSFITLSKIKKRVSIFALKIQGMVYSDGFGRYAGGN